MDKTTGLQLSDSVIAVYRDSGKPYPLVRHSDFPLSVGYDIQLVTRNVHFEKGMRSSVKTIRSFLGLQDHECSPLWGMASGFDQHLAYVVYIQDDLSLLDTLGTLQHECSHIVDYIFENCAINHIDTELRAYYLAWVTDLFMCKMPAIVAKEKEECTNEPT